jgi:1-aminocyclopropane-1-carboxylate deaminase/D-cysteine desulfhydrase-like pyridoxal-dependent ACC family enzyme
VAANGKSSGSKQTKSRSSSGTASKAKGKSSNSSGSRSRARASSSGAKARTSRSGATATRSSASRSRPSAQQTRSNGSNGFVGTVREVAGKAKGPAVAVGATGAAVAGGLLIRSRTRQRKVLGVPVPRSVSKPDIDVKSLAKSLGKASRQFGQTTKTVSRDMERVGEQAERFGKMLD